MNNIDQHKLEKLIAKYNSTDPTIIKRNLIRIIEDSEYRRDSQALADKVNLSVQTIYLYRQHRKSTNINFETALKLANVLGISVEELIK